jgi:hypothetical protein
LTTQEIDFLGSLKISREHGTTAKGDVKTSESVKITTGPTPVGSEERAVDLSGRERHVGHILLDWRHAHELDVCQIDDDDAPAFR